MSPSIRSRRASAPDVLQLHMEYAGKRQVGVKNAGLAAKVGRTVFESLANGLFVSRNAVPIEAAAEAMPFWKARKQQAMTTLYCSFNGYAKTPAPSLWQFDRKNMVEPEDPWVFASDCAEQLSGIFEDTPFLKQGSRPAADMYVGGRQYMTHDLLIGHIAERVEHTRLPRSDEDMAGTIAQLGTAICWAVTGGPKIPAVEFAAVMQSRP